ncbi:LysR family transcriptional regulator [Sphingomonas sp. TF3]|uniref:LysR family transcriptional regulator n=1 Tax=Sphingomonas sp. TF3 TaxID=2495580 RepID=UPI000F87604A|nr:LysR family transcriptional regulator [Sphingomonas sp. TF3]RUN76521.1 LysR family transcriptional regulator [Sphingomonas sp. TF3]
MSVLQKFDLNLFRLLEALYEERSVSRAAERLFITPSAVSHSLRRLRLLMNDELFTRGPRGMMPTPRAHEVARRLHVLLPQLADVINPSDFDPELSERVFAIACVPYLSTMLVPRLAADLAVSAPHANLDIRLLYSSVVDDLDSGRLDVALGNFRRIPPRLITEELLRDDYVWVMRVGNPAAGRKPTLEMLSTVPHVDLLIDGAVVNPIDSYDVRQGLERLVIQNSMAATEEAFGDAGLRREVRYHAPDSIAALAIVARTDAACLVPVSIARMFERNFDLVLFEPPYAATALNIQMLYHQEYGARPAVSWLLDRIRAALPDKAG